MAKKNRKVMHAVVNDQHFPFQDPIAIGLSTDFIRVHKPEVIHVLGDLLDFYCLSRFDKDPNRKGCLQGEIDEAKDYLAELRKACPRATIKYSLGNHENRLQKYIWQNSEELASLRSLSLPHLLELEKLKISCHDDLHPYHEGPLLFVHGSIARKHSGYSAKAHYDRFGCPVIHGHTHRLGSYYHRVWDTQHGAWENGCLCSLDPHYLLKPDWQQGFSAIYFEGNHFTVNSVPIINGTYVWFGDSYTARITKAA
jgi:UDP-2,3-diacylglucosamine pyrophosphatase LpxH